MTIDIVEIAYHRNGVCGVGFHAVRFRWKPDGAKSVENFLAIVFNEPGECAVIGLDRIGTMGVAFAAGNSWRGDNFEGELRAAIEATRGDTSGGHRVGPFCIPTPRPQEN